MNSGRSGAEACPELTKGVKLGVSQRDSSLRCSETKCSAHYPLDSSFRWNDEDDMPVIPGEHRETRNPGAQFLPPRLASRAMDNSE